MICKNCGTEINDNEAYCPICGAKTAEAAVTTNGPKPPFGIALAAAILSELGLIGLIFAIIAKVKMKHYVADGGAVVGLAKAAKILSTIALVLSIIMTVIWLIYIISAIVMIGTIGSAYSYYGMNM